MYVLRVARQPLKLRFTKALYGPYADDLRHVLNEVEDTSHRDTPMEVTCRKNC